MKDVLKLITNNKNAQVYYKIACDDRRATDLQSDYHFDLQETEEINIILGIYRRWMILWMNNKLLLLYIRWFCSIVDYNKYDSIVKVIFVHMGLHK